MINNDLVTVLLPVYNAEKYIKNSIESILNQTYCKFLLLIINDGSIDQSLDIIKRYNDNRIKIINFNQNIGLIKALNIGLDNSKGKYIIRMDADDISELNRIEEQIKYMDSNPAIGVSGCGSRTFGESVNSWETLYPVEHDDIKVKLTHNTSLSHPTVIFNRALLGSIRYNDKYQHIEDYELWVRIIDKFKIGNLNKVLLNYRIHSDQISTVYSGEQAILANELRMKMLSKAGVNPNQDEVKLHKKICSYQFENNPAFLSASNVWFQKIYKSNHNSQYFNKSSLKKFYFKIFTH